MCLCVFMITHIMCDFAQSPDRVYSLNCVIWYNYRWLTAGEHYLHGGVRHILHTGAFKQAWKKRICTNSGKIWNKFTRSHSEKISVSYLQVYIQLVRSHLKDAACWTLWAEVPCVGGGGKKKRKKKKRAQSLGYILPALFYVMVSVGLWGCYHSRNVCHYIISHGCID